MTQVTMTNAEDKRELFFCGTFDETAPELKLGFAGPLRPTTWRLHVTTILRPAISGREAKELRFYRLSMNAPRGLTSFNAVFAYPSPAQEEQGDYGHGFAGLIKDAPAELLDAIEAVTGVALSEARAE